MPDPVEVAIDYVLLSRAKQFADSQSPAIPVALPNSNFTTPALTPTARWLRATVSPGDTETIAISSGSHNYHSGLLQIAVFYGAQSSQGSGGGFVAPARIAAAVIGYFKRGTSMSRDGFTVRVITEPSVRQMYMDEYGWFVTPVYIPYTCFAPDPA